MKRALVTMAVVTAMVGMTSAGTAGAKQAGSGVIVLNGQGNDLDAYTGTKPFKHQTVITNHNADPKGRDINAQICFFPDGKTFIAGEDTGQPDPLQGWGIFKMKGTKVGKLEAVQVGKLQPTYQGAADNAENYGCGILSDGRVVTSDIGNQATGPENGQLIIWFPPFTKGFEETGPPKNGTNGDVEYCKLDIAIGTAGSVQIDDQDRILVSSARGSTAGVLRYTGPFPTAADAEGGCGKTDSTGAPLADSVTREQFIGTDNDLATPNGLAPAPDGGWYAASVINGFINEYDADGAFVRTVLQPPEGTVLGPEPFSTGTPLGMAVAPDGTLYYADIGIVRTDDGIGPGDATGKVWRLRFVDGEPQEPELMAEGLDFPDGIGLYIVKKR